MRNRPSPWRWVMLLAGALLAEVSAQGAGPAAPGTATPGAGAETPSARSGGAAGSARSGGAAGSARAGAAPRGKVETVSRILAVVNDEVITQFDIDEAKLAVLQQLRAAGTRPPSDEVLERQLLERLIVERALLQYAKENGIRVDDAQVERAVQRVADDNKLSIADFRRALEREGIRYERYREDIRTEITAARVREREIDQRTVVTDSEVDDFLANARNTGLNDDYRLAHILVAIPEQARREQIQARRVRAEEALRQIRTGSDFAQVAAAYSDAPDGLRGGDLGWRPAARLPTVFADPVRGLEVGETSEVLRSASGFHIVRLVDKRGADTPTVVEQTRARHILVRVNENVSEADARARIDRLKDRLDAGADFAALARLNSEDASAGRGGDLGWINAGDTVPEFEQALAKLAPGETSAPIRTPFGWHLIQVLERRQQDVTVERSRERARQAIRERKIDENYAEWLRQLRDRAFVELRTEDR